ncbi:MAG TPA: acyltransferase [Xanthomonadaceae bacterium]|jgi:acetyltransferase-like isoleucine patch superfamily enzyme
MNLLVARHYLVEIAARWRGLWWRLLAGSASASGIGRGARIHRGFNLAFSRGSRGLVVGPGLHCRSWCSIVVDGGRLSIGDNLFMNNRCSLNCQSQIEIGDDCLLGEGVAIYDHDHDFSKPEKFRLSGFRSAPVKIGNNVWLGSNVIVLKGSTIGDNVVVAANSVIKGDVPADTLVVPSSRDKLVLLPLRKPGEAQRS